MPPSAVAGGGGGSESEPAYAVQILLRDLESRTKVIRARADDTLGELLDGLRPGPDSRRSELRIVYAGRNLPLERTIGELCLPPDATLHLTSRLRSTKVPGAWFLSSMIVAQAKRTTFTAAVTVNELVRKFLQEASASSQIGGSTSNSGIEKEYAYLDAFLLSGAASELVRLYMELSCWPSRLARDAAARSIQCFLRPDGGPRMSTAPVLMEFCRLIRAGAGWTWVWDPVYQACRHALAEALTMAGSYRPSLPEQAEHAVIEQVIPLAQETADDLVMYMKWRSWRGAPLLRLLEELSSFFFVLRREFILMGACDAGAGAGAGREARPCSPLETALSTMIMSLVRGVYDVMAKHEATSSSPLELAASWVERPGCAAWVHSVWTVLCHLEEWSVLLDHEHFEYRVRATLMACQATLNALVLRVARDERSLRLSIIWITKHKDLLTLEARRHLAITLLPDPEHVLPDAHEMLIDRSRLLSDSYAYVSSATRQQLHTTPLIKFKDEQATGPGVLREWLVMVCHALFDQHQVLFAACPRDKRKFFINPASTVDPMHLEYFRFAGRMVGLCLMHNIQIGISFDKTLFMQLAGRRVTLDGIAEADPLLYSSYREILEMDPALVDSDALGLTFARETNVLGRRKVTDLVDGGRDIAVNSRNRFVYVDLLIQDHFVTSTRHQLIHFAEGFRSMLVSRRLLKEFFDSLEPEDFDQMLAGRNSTIDIEDWKMHTEYSGYSNNDDQIRWFWQVMESMTLGEQRRLLFFWTAVKYLPFNGFGGLDTNLTISRASSKSPGHLPSSSTCFYCISLPEYTSFSMMESRLQVIVQEHVSSSFGAS